MTGGYAMRLPRVRFTVRRMMGVVAVAALVLALFKATGWSLVGTAIILALWVAVVGILTGVWQILIQLDQSSPLPGILSILWASVTMVVIVGLLVATAILVLVGRNGIPACGPFGGR
jgi:hypothetical protein